MYFTELGAEITVQGPQLDPNTGDGLPLTVGLANGNYAVIWQFADGDFAGDLRARIYNAAGTPQGDAFTIFNDNINFELPHNFDVIALPNGGFAVATLRILTTNSTNNSTVTSDIALQLFNANGVASGPVISASTLNGATASTYVSQPELSIANGKLVLVWDGGDAAGTPLNARVFDLGGNPVTAPFAINDGSSGLVLQAPGVAEFSNGNFLAVYREGQAATQSAPATGDIRAQLFNSSGTAVGQSFLVNTNTTGVQNLPHVSVLDNGTAIVTWGDLSSGSMNIVGQLFASDGTRIGSEFILATTGQTTDTNGYDYGLTALHGGGFAIAWNDAVDGHIWAREFNSAGQPLRPETSISNDVGFFPQIDALAGGGYEVVWSNSAARSVYAQSIADTRTVFDPASAPIIANFNPANGWTSQDATPRHVADLNGDGRTDVIGFGNNGVLVAYGQASGFTGVALQLADFGRSTGWTSDNQYHRVVTDVNGDGKSDILGFGTAGTYVSTVNTDNSFSAARLGVVDFGQNQGWTSQDARTRLVGDVNGDGKADIVGFGDNVTFVALGNGDGTFQSVKIAINNFSAAQGWNSDNIYHRDLADVNGDGKLDIVGFGIAGTYVSLSNGDGTFAAAKLTLADFGANQGWTNQDGFARMVADVNGDGKADIVGFTNGGVLVAFGNGDGTFQPVRADVADFGRSQGYTSDNLTHRELADVNHDGQIDIVGFGNAGVVVGYNHASTVF